MDIFTQGIAGAVLAQGSARNRDIRIATLAGFAAGLLPDADALIRSAGDPLLTLEFHRQFSHSLLFIPLGAVIATLLLLPFMRGKLPLSWLYLYTLAGYASAGLLDACTSYGTQLLWPFSDKRIAWNLIAIIDPVFTIGILALLIAGWRKKNRIYPLFAVLFAACYLLLAYSQQQLAFILQKDIADGRRHIIERSIIKPTLGNIVLWRSIYEYQGRFYVDAIRPSLFAANRVYTGDSIAGYHVDERTHDLAQTSTQYRDILRFSKLSDGYLVKHPKDDQVIGDIRYAMLPNSIEPLWGIRLNPGDMQQHATEALFRENSSTVRQKYFRMLQGKDL